MTDAERDLLASVYLDGEATPDEAAQVERDPDLLARVETFRTVRDTVAIRASSAVPPTGLKDRQINAALDLFDSQPVPAPQPEPFQEQSNDTVIDLTNRRQQRDVATGGRRSERLSLLAAAAGAMVLLVGGVFVAGRVGGGSDESSVAMQATEDASDDASEEAAEMIEPAADADFDDAMADDAAMEDEVEEAMEEEAVDSEAALSTGEAAGADENTANTQALVGDAEEEFAEDAAADETAAAEAPSTTTTLPDIRRESLPDEGFFPQEPVVIYPTQPTGQELIDDLTLAWRDPDSSLCGATYVHPQNALLIAYLPIEITAGPDGQPQIQEALYFTSNNDVEVVLVVRDTCAPA